MGRSRNIDELSKDGVRGGTSGRVVCRTWPDAARRTRQRRGATTGEFPGPRGEPLQSREFLGPSLRACLSVSFFVASLWPFPARTLVPKV